MGILSAATLLAASCAALAAPAPLQPVPAATPQPAAGPPNTAAVRAMPMPGAETAEPQPLSTLADRVYTAARAKLLQVRTLVRSAGKQSSIGSGFLVSPEGLAITNYHVVSQFALEPNTYQLEFALPDGSRGPLRLLAFDVVNDLAVVQLEKLNGAVPYFDFNPRAVDGKLGKGERLYAMGNPLDLGFTIVEGNYNGLVEKSYQDRIHLAGAMNAGMSGGPTVTSDGKIAGINVAKRLDGENVSFLVPARFAVALLERARTTGPLEPAQARKEITRQLHGWQDGLVAAWNNQGEKLSGFGPYRAAESAATWFNCWSQTNQDDVPKPRASVQTTRCSMQSELFIADNLHTGEIAWQHSYVRSRDLNAFQFSHFLSQHMHPGWGGRKALKRVTRERCQDDFFQAGEGRPVLRTVWCARAYREFDGVYDVSVLAVTQDKGTEALVSRLSLQGFTYEHAMALSKRFLGAIQWQ